MTRTRKPIRIASCTVLVLAAMLGNATAHAAPGDAPKASPEPSDDNTRVRSLFRKAAAASQAGQYQEAHQLLLDAWSIRQTYDLASSLAQVEIQLKRYRDAAEHLEFCIRNFAPVESEQTLDQAKKAFSEAKTRVATVRLSTNRKGAELFVDSVRIGSEPLPAVVFVEPGPHRLAARLDDATAEQSLITQAGKEYVAELTLDNHEPTAAAPVLPEASPSVVAPEPSPPPAPVSKSSYAPAIVTASIAGAAVVTSVVLFLEANHKDSQRKDQIAQLPGSNRCGAQSPNASACSEIQSLANDVRTFKALSLVSLGAAAAAGVTTYFLWPRSKGGSQVGFRARLVPTAAGPDFVAGFVGTF